MYNDGYIYVNCSQYWLIKKTIKYFFQYLEFFRPRLTYIILNKYWILVCENCSPLPSFFPGLLAIKSTHIEQGGGGVREGTTTFWPWFLCTRPFQTLHDICLHRFLFFWQFQGNSKRFWNRMTRTVSAKDLTCSIWNGGFRSKRWKY